jgi:uncharacterized membrane protein YphA (DoxX/SURF4 family)
MARRLTRFASILGLFFLAYGIAWLTIWNQGVQADLDLLPLDLTPPAQARLMIVGGLLLLLGANITRLIVRMSSGRGSARAQKP